MNKLFAPTFLTAAAALLAACNSTSSRSGYAVRDTEPTYTASQEDRTDQGCAAKKQQYDNDRYSNTDRSYSSDQYSSDRTDRELRRDTYIDRSLCTDPNVTYSSDAGCSLKHRHGNWSNQSSAGYSNDRYSSSGEQYNPSSDIYSSSPDNTTSSSMAGSADSRATNVPDHYTNATPGGFDNTWAWRTNGAKTTPLSEFSSSSSSSMTTSSADTGTPIALSGDVSPDTRILSILHVKDQEEVEIGRLAATNASSQEVKDFGARLVKDHTEHDAKVRSVASAANISLMDPDQVKAMIAKEKGKPISDMKDPVAELRNLKGIDFDKKFAMKMKEGHAKVIAMVEKAQYDVTNQNVKDLLAQSLPTLREHEQMAAKLSTGETTNDSYTSPDNR